MTETRNFTLDLQEDGIAVITWNVPGRSMNVITLQGMDELDALIDEVVANEAITGAIIASGKKDFSGGADLTMLEALLADFRKEQAAGNQQAATERLFTESRRLSEIYRKLEICGKPFVAAMNGTALGGACELALACHGRVLANDEKTRFGLPEVKVGLFPGAGGTTRIARMLDAQNALQMLTQGRTWRATKAKSLKLVDVLAAPDEVVAAAKAMLADGLDPIKPWDKQGFKQPGGRVYSPAGFQLWPAAGALYRKETFDNYPAIKALVRTVYEGLLVSMDEALRIESRYFAHILQSPVAANMIRSLFISMGALNKGARRPANEPETNLKKVGIIGAGFMGAGIAYVSAKAGLEVVLLDQSIEAAAKGKAYSDDLMTKAMKKKRATEADKEALLARITPSDDYQSLAGCDLVVEAVFEDRGVKKAVTEQAEAVLAPGTIFASNTSTLPITSLADNARAASDFIGIHFFSPVDKMLLVEIIMGEKTGDRALATALDFVRKIRKTPIVVNDCRGFFANRAVGAYLLEGHLMLTEGVPAPMVENLARQAGMPVGPLSLTDEVALDLVWKILQATRKDLGEAAINPAQYQLIRTMVEEKDRLGRKNAKGFYDYQGRNKALWPELSDLAEPVDPDGLDREELQQRFLVAQALEAARCFAEEVVTDVREADVGSILGFGFAPYSGGALSYIDTMGTKTFVALCDRLAVRHGPRFMPNDLLRDMAEKGETFYGRFPPEKPGLEAAE